MKLAFDAIMLIGFGGPTRPGEIRPFLDQLLRTRPVSPERYEEVVRHYERIGGRSPYNELTFGQARALAGELAREGIRLAVVAAMRNWTPYIEDTLARLSGGGVQRVLGLIMSAFQCEASWDRYQAAVAEARDWLGKDAPTVDYVEPWHDDPRFIEALAARTAAAIGRLEPAERPRTQLVFTAHSIPVAMAERSRYVEQIAAAADKVAKAVEIGDWTLAFQNRSGNPGDRWLEPDVVDVIKRLSGHPAVVVPIGFLCDHVEVLYDLDVGAAAAARSAGVRLERAATVGDHPAFIGMMAAAVRRRLGGAPPR